MKPMGRKHYKDNTGGKHTSRIAGKVVAWWDSVCRPNKKAARQSVKTEIKSEMVWVDCEQIKIKSNEQIIIEHKAQSFDILCKTILETLK